MNLKINAVVAYICLVSVASQTPTDADDQPLIRSAESILVAEDTFLDEPFALASTVNCSDCSDCDTAQPCFGCRFRHVYSGEALKGRRFGDCGWLDIGGGYRGRYHREINMRPGTTGGLSGVDDQFWLHQTRLWFDGGFNPRLKFRVGLIDAASSDEDFPSRGREVNRHDLYQAHISAVLHEGEGTLTARVGRQEVKYGSARLMMAPNWANRRRAHDGVRFIWESEKWEINPFWVRPARRNRSTFNTFDSTNLDQQLYGIFSTYTQSENSKLDLYWLAFDLIRGGTGARYDTIGARAFGSRDEWLYEFEGGIQLGDNPDDSAHTAGFCTLGVGRKCESIMWEPELWVFYDWASGDNTTENGFHTYVQRAHYYLGFMDLFGRRNIEDLNIRLTTKPTEKLTLLAWCHFFSLANGNDVPYNLNMRPYAGLTAGSAGSTTLGTELDFLATFDLDEQTQFRLGYSYFWSGSFYSTTAGVPYDQNAEFYYGHVRYKF